MKIRILAAINDPGGTLALLPLLRRLNQDEKYQLDIVAAGPGRDILSSGGLGFQRESSNIDSGKAQDLFVGKKSQLLLTATSWQSNLEQQLRNQAANKGVASVVVLDFWNNYRLRFAGASYDLESIPDIICVPDANAAREMIADGFPANSIQISGQPFLEEIFAAGPQDINGENRQNVLFLSQPSVVDGKTLSRFDDLQLVARALGRQMTGKRPVLEIKLHPKEEVSSGLQEMVAELDNDSCHVRLLPLQTMLADSLLNTESVIGYYTMALFQARAMGKRTISVRGYELNHSLEQAMKKAGIINAALDESAISAALGLENSSPDIKWFHQGAVENIMALIR